MLRNLLLAGLLALYACETEIDLVDPRGPEAVVYGLLDLHDTIHYIKITKTFAGEGNAYDFARVADSSVIEDLQAYIIEESQGSEISRTLLRDTILPAKEPGLFYTDKNVIYYFIDPNLSPLYQYRIVFEYQGKEVSSSTLIVGNGKFDSPNPNPLFDLGLAHYNNAQIVDVTSRFTFFAGSNAKTYEVIGTFSYKEFYASGDSAAKSISLTVPVSAINEGTVSGLITTDKFFSSIQTQIPEDPNVTQREIGQFTYEVYGGAEELKNYLSINQPVTGIVQERPEYTNINNGYGLFSSRNVQLLVKNLDRNTHRAMILSEEMLPFKFCSTRADFLNDTTMYCRK